MTTFAGLPRAVPARRGGTAVPRLPVILQDREAERFAVALLSSSMLLSLFSRASMTDLPLVLARPARHSGRRVTGAER
jgi:hypothetical protein